MTKENMKEIEVSNGLTVKVDISDQACEEFGFKYKQKVQAVNNDTGTILGVALQGCQCKRCLKDGRANEKSIYIAIDRFNGLAACIPKSEIQYVWPLNPS